MKWEFKLLVSIVIALVGTGIFSALVTRSGMSLNPDGLATATAQSGKNIMKTYNAINAIALAGCTLAFTGCGTVENYSLTYRLWDTSDLSKWSEPAENSNLALFQATNRTDVLVRYDAFSESHSAVQQRAYYLQPNQARIVANRQPKFVPSTAANGMMPIPVLSIFSGISNVPPATSYVVTNNDGRGFTLYEPTKTNETFNLPVYPETSGVPVRVALTPLAVAGDTVMVGVVASVAAIYLWLASGAPGINSLNR